jgi:uncharacterized protein YaaW (UPF0174 family)
MGVVVIKSTDARIDDVLEQHRPAHIKQELQLFSARSKSSKVFPKDVSQHVLVW